MVVGANPTAWFVVIALLSIVLNYLNDLAREMPMKKYNKTGQIAKIKHAKSYLIEIVKAIIETSWAIMASLAAGLVTPSIHAKGAPRMS